MIKVECVIVKFIFDAGLGNLARGSSSAFRISSAVIRGSGYAIGGGQSRGRERFSPSGCRGGVFYGFIGSRHFAALCVFSPCPLCEPFAF